MLAAGHSHIPAEAAFAGHNLEGVGHNLEGGPGHVRVQVDVHNHIVLGAVLGSRSAQAGLVDERRFAFVDLASKQPLPFPFRPLRLPPSACPPLVATE